MPTFVEKYKIIGYKSLDDRSTRREGMMLPLVCEYSLMRDPVTLLMHERSIMRESSESSDFDWLLTRWISAKMAESSGLLWLAMSSLLFRFLIIIPDALFGSDVTTGGGKPRSMKSALTASPYPANMTEGHSYCCNSLHFSQTSSIWPQYAGTPVHRHRDRSCPLLGSN